MSSRNCKVKKTQSFTTFFPIWIPFISFSALIAVVKTSYSFLDSFPYRLLQNIEYSSLCYTVGPCWSLLVTYFTPRSVYTFAREGNGYPFQYSCLENSIDRGACWTTVYGVAESDMTE